MYKDPIVGAAVPLGAAPGGGYTTYTEREYVWGPDYVDECLWQVTKPGGVLHVLQDASKDVVALLDEAGAVARQYSYDPYGQVQFEDVFGTPAHSRLGHHGLFFDRLDADAPAVELGVGARGLYHNRNRTYDPRTGRFTTSDPNGTGVRALREAQWGMPCESEGGAYDALLAYRDGMSSYAYLTCRPLIADDPLGLEADEYDEFWEDLFSTDIGLPGPSDFLTGALEALVTDYSENLNWDVDWAGEWGASDDDHSRGDNLWIDLALGRGIYDAFNISIPLLDFEFNPLDLVGKRKKAGGGGGGGTRRAKRGETVHTQKGRDAHSDYPDALEKVGIRRPQWKFEHTIPGVGRLDAIDPKAKIIRELKPNTPSGRARGLRQITRYLGELERHYGDPPGTWTGYLDFYDVQ